MMRKKEQPGNKRMRYDFCSDGHVLRVAPQPPGHHAGSQHGFGPVGVLGDNAGGWKPWKVMGTQSKSV